MTFLLNHDEVKSIVEKKDFNILAETINSSIDCLDFNVCQLPKFWVIAHFQITFEKEVVKHTISNY